MRTIDPFDLTPLSIHRGQAAAAALGRYVLAWIALVGIIAGICIFRWNDRQRQQIDVIELMSQAIPIRDQRFEALRLQRDNDLLRRCVDSVATARPQDSLLQCFAAIIESTSVAGLRPTELHLQLPHEVTSGDAASNISSGIVKLTVEVGGETESFRAHESLTAEARLGAAKTLTISQVGQSTRVELAAVPRAEVVLP